MTNILRNAIKCDKQCLIDRFLYISSKIPNGQLLVFDAGDWDSPWGIGANNAFSLMTLLAEYFDEDLPASMSPSDYMYTYSDYIIVLYSSDDSFGVLYAGDDTGELTDFLVNIFNTVTHKEVISNPKEVISNLSSINPMTFLPYEA